MSYLVLEIFAIYCLNIFFGSFLERRPMRRLEQAGIYLLALLFYMLPYMLWRNPYLNLLFGVAAVFLLTFLYTGRWPYKLLLVFWGLALGLISERIGFVLQSVMESDVSAAATKRKIYMIIGMAVSRLLLFIFVKIFCLLRRKGRETLSTTKYWWLALLLPVFSIYMLCQLYQWSAGSGLAGIGEMGLIVFVLAILLSNLLAFCLYDKLLQSYGRVLEFEQIRLQDEYCVSYKKLTDASDKKMRTWKHDNKKFLLALKLLIEQKEQDSALAILNKRLTDIEAVEVIPCGDMVAGAVINRKIQEARNENITVTSRVRIQEKMKFPADDLAVLIGNSMDNAIEACMAAGVPEDRWIDITMEYDRGWFQYIVRNKYSELKREEGKLRSTKGDGPDHGMGISSMELIAKRNHGALKIITENQIFELNVHMIEE